MAIQIVLSLRDTKAELFLQPFFVPTVGVAYRDIAREIARGGDGNQLALFTKDFELWQLGTFDSDTGVLDSAGSPLKLCDVTALAVPE